ncbi:MAG: hypothetical protein Q8P56_01020 [Candidatus Uhrbacteria bacterium]|nr:hypothetical protein [Candidatus Uhrbacteria bacterium]
MAEYRKKPVVIEAIQWEGANTVEISQFTGISLDEISAAPFVNVLVIHTLEGDMTANKGDWIIKGVKGELYPCKPDIFEATYDKV